MTICTFRLVKNTFGVYDGVTNRRLVSDRIGVVARVRRDPFARMA